MAMPTARREREMRDFRAAARAVMSNARCLTEGMDVPAVKLIPRALLPRFCSRNLRISRKQGAAPSDEYCLQNRLHHTPWCLQTLALSALDPIGWTTPPTGP